MDDRRAPLLPGGAGEGPKSGALGGDYGTVSRDSGGGDKGGGGDSGSVGAASSSAAEAATTGRRLLDSSGGGGGGGGGAAGSSSGGYGSVSTAGYVTPAPTTRASPTAATSSGAAPVSPASAHMAALNLSRAMATGQVAIPLSAYHRPHPSGALAWAGGGPGGNKRNKRPRFLYDQRRCRVCLPPLSVLLLGGGMLAVGVLLLLPQLPVRSGLHIPDSPSGLADGISYALLATGAVFPLACLLLCVWAATPSRAARQRAAVRADALLEELTSAVNLGEHYDVAGAERAAEGTVLLLAGAACPRITMRSFSDALAVHYRTLSVDLPGHGSLVGVGFSLARCERLVTKVLERELNLAPGALASTTAAGTTPLPQASGSGLAAAAAAGVGGSGGGPLPPAPSAGRPISNWGESSARRGGSGGDAPGGRTSSRSGAHAGAVREMALDAQLYGSLPFTPPAFDALPSPPGGGGAYLPHYRDSHSGVELPGGSGRGGTGSSVGGPGSDILFRIAEAAIESEVSVPGKAPTLPPSAEAGSPPRGVAAPAVASAAVTSAVASSSIIIVAYGAAAYVAAYLAARHRSGGRHRAAGPRARLQHPALLHRRVGVGVPAAVGGSAGEPGREGPRAHAPARQRRRPARAAGIRLARGRAA